MSDVSGNQLAKVSKLFEALDEAGRHKLLGLAKKTRHPDGYVVCTEGEVGDEFYVLVMGRVRVSADDLGEAKEIAVLEKGAFFGEMAVLNHEKRSATVTALGEIELVRFPRAAVDQVLAEYPAAREMLSKVGVMRSEEALAKLMG
ncbi:MAG: cyclic nucleotide-binding domain-containing protein [Deltaproteobacteria bacterium]|nr:cyclic nucleotide-binding domain-containing protein [Deltaproteobacteria bacterium]